MTYQKAMAFTNPMLLVRYEDLKTDLHNQLLRLSQFLQVPVASETVHSVVQNSQGNFQRPPPTYNYMDPYDNRMQTLINKSSLIIEQLLFQKFDEKGYFPGT